MTTSETDNARARAKNDTPLWEPAFLEALAASGNVSGSASKAGVARSVVYRRYDKNKTFQAAWNAAIEDAKDALAMTIYKAGMDGDWRAAAWYLSRIDPLKWGER